MDIALILFWGIAVWRLTHILWKESGPLQVFTRMRAFLAKHQKRSGGLFDMVSCFNCLSVWISITPAIILSSSLTTFVVFLLVLSAEAIFINQLNESV